MCGTIKSIRKWFEQPDLAPPEFRNCGPGGGLAVKVIAVRRCSVVLVTDE